MNRPIGLWLLACCALVFVVLVQGGATRLTHSGLSIVEWKPVTGVLPPLDDAQWERAFQDYQRTPEYQQVNDGMGLADFKEIYWMEYLHRLLARLAGLVFALPFFYFLLSRKLDRRLLSKLAVVAALWALQGGLGWFMVKSGLVNEPRVSHYRLTAHLLTACVLYGAMLWTALELLIPRSEQDTIEHSRLRRVGAAILALVLITIGSGGLVAGLRAGFIYNTFPKMLDYWIPPFLFKIQPPLRNLFDNNTTVQFDHRLLALVLTLGTLGLWLVGIFSDLPRRTKLAFHVLMGAVLLQAALGVATLLRNVPLSLGVAHQGGALILLGAAIFFLHQLTP
ncbi:MAG: COX15/CtaA family protein [Elusimicrobia bacterium]|nr:COX15/CtaA family protein [Elusimicrobiota bacterium]